MLGFNTAEKKLSCDRENCSAVYYFEMSLIVTCCSLSHLPLQGQQDYVVRIYLMDI